ncbi:uncharacterized protein [Solanum lycopersicum]|uniref:uncharacterized protein n=1 Tax=Solanum lycopersicum TaxID=4081 RepID=UPI00374A69A5
MSVEVEASSNQALAIKVNGVILKFTIRMFALITGLNCVGVVEDFKFNTEEPNRLIVQYFGGNEIIRKSDLFDRFNGKVWVDNDDDAIKFAILYFVHMFVHSGEKRSLRIPRIHFDLVESGRYMHYPWGRKIFEWLLQSINKIYECMGKRQTNFARKISDRNPRVLNWKTNVVPSLMEIVVLQLPPEGVEKSTEGVQTEPHCDIDEHVLSGQNSDVDFVNPSPPSMKVTGKRKKGQSVSPAKRNNINNHTAAKGRQHFASPIASENQNQVDCDNSPMRNLINVDAGFSSSKSIIPSIPQPSFVFDKLKKIRSLVFESQHDFTDQDDNDEEDQFIFPTPIQSIVTMEGSPQSQFELDDSLMPSLSDIKSTSSVQPIIFELKHPSIFDLISGNRDIIMWDAHRCHDQDRYKKGKALIPVPFDFGVDIVDNKNWFYNLYSKRQLLNDLHINVIFYYLRKKAKYDVDNRYKYTTVDCVFTSKISSIWKKYEDLDSDVWCADEEHFIGDYIRGYKVHADIPWHLVDHVFIPVNVKENFYWVLAVLSVNDRRVYVYDSYRATGHDATIRKEVTKLA